MIKQTYLGKRNTIVSTANAERSRYFECWVKDDAERGASERIVKDLEGLVVYSLFLYKKRYHNLTWYILT